MILSIDCGIKNLAMCLIDPLTKKIHQWDVSGVPPKHADGIFPCMVKHLNGKPWTLEAKTVLIEKQPDRNRGMKGIENLLHTYFLVKEKDVVIWDARHKIPDHAGAGKAMYAKRKKASVERARAFISKENENWVKFFDDHKKKDDLADTVMQALSFIEKRPTDEGPKKEKKAAPRKPTENQKNTKYSKANLAWLVKTGAKQDARFKKDLARYYSSIDELISEFSLKSLAV
jgi:fructose-specific phosphotransferase system component IIB